MAKEESATMPGQRTPSARQRLGPSIGDVAALAGVSSQTVSRVSTGAENVRPKTKSRVLAAMQELGYSPNIAARALKYGSFGTLGVIAHQLSRTGEARTFEAVVEAARDQGYTVTLIDVISPSSLDITAAAGRLSHQAIDGLVIVRAETATPITLALPPHLPVVISDSRLIGHHPAVGADQTGGTRRAVEHLLGLGHATVHLLAGPANSGPAQLRRTAWRKTLKDAGRKIPELYQGDWSAASGYAQGQRIALDRSITAVFCANDEMAAGLCLALHEHGLRVPNDVSVVGFDGIPLAEFIWPPLTTIAQDFPSIGRALVQRLMEQLRDGADLTDSHTVVPVELIIRASTAPPPAAG